VGPPAEYGTTIVIGREGQGWAKLIGTAAKVNAITQSSAFMFPPFYWEN
jgi:hypothetical protein